MNTTMEYVRWILADAQPASTCPRCQGPHCSQCCPTLREPKVKRTRKRRQRCQAVTPTRRSPAPSRDYPWTSEGWYTRFYPLIRHRIKRRIHNVPASQRDDMLANALAFSWGAFQRLYKQNVPPLDAARIASHLAATSALNGRQFCSTRQHGYVDALDSRFQRESVDLGLFAAPKEAKAPAYDVEDMGVVSSLIARMPVRLKGLAFCLAANDSMRRLVRDVIPESVAQTSGELNQREIAAYLNCSRRTVQLLVAELRAWTQTDASNRSLAQTLADWLGE